MKKIFTFAMMAVMAISASAAQTMKFEKIQPVINHHKSVMTADQKQAFALKGEKIAKIATDDAASDTLYYSRPNYAWNWGFTPDGGMYAFAGISVSTQDSLVFIKDALTQHTETAFAWFINDQQASDENEETLVYATPGLAEDGASGYMPVLMDNNGNEYMYGQSEDAQYVIFGNAFEDGMQPFTKCAMYTSTAINENGWDCYSVPWDGTDATYFMGTGMDLSQYGMGLVDTLVNFFGTPNEAMTIDTISIYVWSNNAQPIGSEGITLAVVDENNLYAQYVATNNDLVGWTAASDGSYYGMLNFPVSFTAPGEVAVYVWGFNGQGTGLGCLTDYYSAFTFSGDVDPTYFAYNGRLRSYGNNIAMFFNARFGAAEQAISNESYAVKAIKAVRNGQLIIEKGNKKFNVLGAQL